MTSSTFIEYSLFVDKPLDIAVQVKICAFWTRSPSQGRHAYNNNNNNNNNN